MAGWTYGTTVQKAIWRTKVLIRREREGQQERVWGYTQYTEYTSIQFKIKQKYKSMLNPKLSCLTFMSFYCIKQIDNAIVFPSIKYVGNFPGKVNYSQKEAREIPVVTYATYMEDKGVRKIGLMEENQKINFQSCFVAFKKEEEEKMESIQQLNWKSSYQLLQ